MPKTYFLPEKSRPKMQKVWGEPLFGTESEIKQQYQDIIDKKRYKTIITVGDYCSHHLQSDIKIFDKKVQRKDFSQKHICAVTVDNPAGTIQKESWNAVRQALKEKINLCVNGEEDLLVICAVTLAKPKTLVVYGFPNKGICLLEVNTILKKEFKQSLQNNFQIKKPG